MADLQGPKLRVGTFPDGPIRLEKGAAFRLELKPGPGNAQRATLPHPEIFAAIGPGTDLLLDRSEEHTSELQSLMRISYAVFCLKKKKTQNHKHKFSPALENIPTNLNKQNRHQTIRHTYHKSWKANRI